MRWNLRTMMTVVGVGATLASATLASGCMVRARARVTTEPVYVVEEAPPPPREERITVRPGYVWIRGRWESIGGQWEWRAGHWQRERAGYGWEPGHWERRGGRYHWIEGRWEARAHVRVEHDPGRPADRRYVEPRDHRDAPPPTDYRTAPPPRDHRTAPPPRDHRDRPQHTVKVSIHPTMPPPAPRAEPTRPRRGYIWVSGRYKWESGEYVWVNGHWERERRGFSWEPGHWERRGDHYEWVEGRWRR
jgi:hypothetical protein